MRYQLKKKRWGNVPVVDSDLSAITGGQRIISSGQLSAANDVQFNLAMSFERISIRRLLQQWQFV